MQQLTKHSESIMNKKLYMGVFDSMLVKYGAVMVGYAVVGLPVFGPGSAEYLARIGSDSSAITRDYVRNSSLLINLAKAIGRIVISYKEIQQLAGYTSLVYEMKEVLDDLHKGKYIRPQVHQDKLDRPRSRIEDINSIAKGQLI
jgi:ATP-binding cassette subfamily D (ALD) protein 3